MNDQFPRDAGPSDAFWGTVERQLDELLLLDARAQEEELKRIEGVDEMLAAVLREAIAPGNESPTAQKNTLFYALRSSVVGTPDREHSPSQPAQGRAGDETRKGTRPSSFESRFQFESELGSGGMGVVESVREPELHRSVAIKTAKPTTDALIFAERESRLVAEARVMASLSHPNIPAVHEIGVTDDGRAFYSMKVVEGVTLRKALDLHLAGDPEYSFVRLLESVRSTAEAVAFAHEHHVIHRDIKPANIKVGRFGEVALLDWGVARRLDGSDAQEQFPGAQANETSSTEGPPVTQSGTIIGSPPYIAPEQIACTDSAQQPTADVYSLGCLLYEVLAGRPPYANQDGHLGSSYSLRRQIQDEEPEPIESAAKRRPKRLLQVCRRAMARDTKDRFQTAGELVDELDRFFDARSSKVFQATLLERIDTFRRRRPAAATLIAASALALVGFTFMGGKVLAKSKRIAELEPKVMLARLIEIRDELDPPTTTFEGLRPQSADVAQSMGKIADELAVMGSRIEVLRESSRGDQSKISESITPALVRSLGPASYRAEWLERNIADVMSMGDPAPGSGMEPAAPQQVEDEAFDPRGSLAAWQAEFNAELENVPVSGLRELLDANTESSGIGAEELLIHQWDRLTQSTRNPIGIIKRRLEDISPAARSSQWHGSWKEAWEHARSSIADPKQCPAYGGLDVPAQSELLPLRQDPHSGLWEFAHLPSGRVPATGDDPLGPYELQPDTAVILVLLPGGAVTLGASSDKDHPRHDPNMRVESGEDPITTVALDPYYIAKYEITQGQWSRWTGANPSFENLGSSHLGEGKSLIHPVEGINWFDAYRFAWTLGLVLPTGAQWEVACRAGTETPWSSGADADTLREYANVMDQSYAQSDRPQNNFSRNAVAWDDGWPMHAQVGSFKPNPFGLHDMHGNVWEFCLDPYNWSLSEDVRYVDGSGLCLPWDSPSRMARGGSFAFLPQSTRSTRRARFTPRMATSQHGLRVARPLTW